MFENNDKWKRAARPPHFPKSCRQTGMWLPMAYINDYGGTLDYDQISHKNQDFQYNQNMDQYQILDLKKNISTTAL